MEWRYGGQAGERSFPSWRVYVSDQLTDSEYAAGPEIAALAGKQAVEVKRDLHLATSVRSFRSEKVSRLVKEVLDLETAAARETLRSIGANYPLVLTRDLGAARAWLRRKARGSERYGIVVSSQAERLKPHAVDVRTPVNPVPWFLNGKDDVRSSYYLEDVATEFQVQGLELDWACVVWDADFRYKENQENHRDTEARRLRHLDAPPSPRGGVVGDLEESPPAILREENHRDTENTETDTEKRKKQEDPFGGFPPTPPGGLPSEAHPPGAKEGTWEHWSFRGNRWERIRSAERQAYLKNAYRVLLTRARQGMVIVVPEGDDEDQTRRRGYYDGTYEYLRRMGMGEI